MHQWWNNVLSQTRRRNQSCLFSSSVTAKSQTQPAVHLWFVEDLLRCGSWTLGLTWQCDLVKNVHSYQRCTVDLRSVALRLSTHQRSHQSMWQEEWQLDPQLMWVSSSARSRAGDTSGRWWAVSMWLIVFGERGRGHWTSDADDVWH